MDLKPRGGGGAAERCRALGTERRLARARASARTCTPRKSTCSIHTHTQPTYTDTAKPGIVSSRENEVFVGGTLFSCCVYFPRNAAAPPVGRRGPLSRTVYWSAPGERSQRETRKMVTGGSRRRPGKIDACKRSVYAFVYRTAYGGSMCRATKTRATS